MKTSKEKLNVLGYEETGKESFCGTFLTCYRNKKRRNKTCNKENKLPYDANFYICVYPDFSFIIMLDRACLSPHEIHALAEEIKKLEIKDNEN